MNTRFGTHPIWQLARACLAVAFLLGLLGTYAPDSAMAQSNGGNDAPLDARLGGSIASFEDKYGEPTNEPDEDIDSKRSYRNKNYQYLSTYAIDGYVHRVTFSSDRRSVEEAERKTWTIGKATSIAKRFLPADAECGETEKINSKKALRASCTSVALTAILFPADYQRLNRAGDAGSVSFVLTLDKRGGKKVTGIEVAAGTMSLEEAGVPEPVTTATTVADKYNVSGPATDAEKQYFRDVQGIILQAAIAGQDIGRIGGDPDFANDPVLWFELADALRPFHAIYAQWLDLAPPTARLEAFHQATADALYNFDQAATNFDLALETFDVTYLYLSTNNLSAANDALDLAMVLMAAWEQETGFDISQDL